MTMLAAKIQPAKTKSAPPVEETKNLAEPPPKTAFNPVWARLALGIQPKLKVSVPDDPYEREANRIADTVMRMPEPVMQRTCAACSAGGATCPSCDEEETRVQRKADGANGAGEVSSDFATSAACGCTPGRRRPRRRRQSRRGLSPWGVTSASGPQSTHLTPRPESACWRTS
jgi:hypothetical protein